MQYPDNCEWPIESERRIESSALVRMLRSELVDYDVDMTKSQHWKNKTAVVCGGSSGLGKQIALRLAAQSTHLAILGRDANRLAQTREELLQLGAQSVTTFSIDMRHRNLPSSRPFDDTTNDAAVSLDGSTESLSSARDWQAFEDWLRNNPLDLLINAIGKSDRGRISHLDSTQVLSLIEDNLLCSLNCIQACLASLQQTHGTFVHIASLAGIVASPNMGGYAIAKHALVAMHRQLRVELTESGVHSLLVCPGPIAREDNDTRYRDLVQERGLDVSQAKPGAGVKLSLLDPVKLADQILDAAAKGQLELVVPSKAKWLSAISAIAPSWADSILRRYLTSVEH